MLFPAVPKLGPIYREITHYVPLDFPLLLVVPALAIDLTWRRVRTWNALPAAAAMGTLFLVTLFVSHWPFADFVMAHGRNWFFHADNYVYWQSVASERFAFQYRRPSPSDWPPLVDGFVALAFAIFASFVGLVRGRWMTRVQR
jgi:hypothetical protein